MSAKALGSRRELLKRSLHRIKNFIEENPTQTNAAVYRARLSRAQECWAEFGQIQKELIQLKPSSHQLEEIEAENEAFEELYFEVVAELESNVESLSSGAASLTPTPQKGSFPVLNVSLPRLSLPTFSGEFDSWISFHDTFESIVNSNPQLTDVQKFHYLKSCLKGEAADTIGSLVVSEENYMIAWDLLKANYADKWAMIRSHISSILELEPIRKETSDALKKFINSFLKNLRALESFGCQTRAWDEIMVTVLTSKLPSATIAAWENTELKAEIPTMQELFDCLMKRLKVTKAVEGSASANSSCSARSAQISQPRVNARAFIAHHLVCPICSDQHSIWQCKKFNAMSTKERFGKVKELRLCVNCLKSNHSVTNCGSSKCKTCSKAHHTLLHFERPPSDRSENKETDSSCEQSSTSLTVSQGGNKFLFLSTAVVQILDKEGRTHSCRAILDSGSQANFISERMLDKLHLSTRCVSTSIAGISSAAISTSQIVNTEIFSRFNTHRRKMSCLVVPKITQAMPPKIIHIDDFKIPENLSLADPTFNIPGEIDLLIGVELFFDLLCVGQIKSTPNRPVLQKTKFGWVVAGACTKEPKIQKSVCNLAVDFDLQKFWDIEEDGTMAEPSPEGMACEEHFSNTFSREPSGRFRVRLPFKEDPQLIGSSKNIAITRLKSMQRKMSKNDDFAGQYQEFLAEYLELGHMSATEESESDRSDGFYLPHHGVLKVNSLTTKMRVVFDASVKPEEGLSLNEALMIGPVIQPKLFNILVKFRTHEIALTADITKMYRQINLAESDTKWQKIAWQPKYQAKPSIFKLNTLTYGMAPSSFIATRCLKQLAIENSAQHPKACEAILTNFYMDDLLTGADSVQEAIILRDDITTILSSGCFPLRKWASNNSFCLPPAFDGSDHAVLQLDSEEGVKTLGLTWIAAMDAFKYEICVPSTNAATKRNILSAIARIFDPLGLLAPVIVTAKIIMQRLWQENLKWDESVPQDIHTAWERYSNLLPLLNRNIIPRRIFCNNPVSIQLHGFGDASEIAYGACLYIRSTDKNNVHQVRLVASKSRVAPLKKQTLPRLELCAALLLAELYNSVSLDFGKRIDNVRFWSDSTIVLSWLAAPSLNWKTFVANRVSKIQQLTAGAHWSHVSSECNPADLASRGIPADQLCTSKLWWSGPDWLCCNEEDWPQELSIIQEENLERKAVKPLVCLAAEEPLNLLQKFSSLAKLFRVVAYLLRFVEACRTKKKFDSELTGFETSLACERVMKLVQETSFADEINALKHDRKLHSKSKIASLNPFLDENGLLRVGGRLKHSNLGVDAKHPILLPRNHHVTTLIIRHEHLNNLHAGVQATLYAVRQKYWPLAGKSIVRQIIHKCMVCYKATPRNEPYFMGDLPADRITPARAFSKTGVDYCGPILVRGKGRGTRQTKSYLSIFVCFATKAVHIEVVTDLTSEAFIAALRRFIARRGQVSDIYSDNGTTFVGANRELKDMLEVYNSQRHRDIINRHCLSEGINWHFIPARSPHFGGLWEAAVKSAKQHLKRVVGNSALSLEELMTLTCQIEACMNSRPLSPLSCDPNDLSPLTPGHFLVGGSLTAPAEPELSSIQINRLSRYQHVQRLLQHFWQRWSREYLHQLTQRNKWTAQTAKKWQPGALVLLKDANLPPLRWKLGRVIELHPGQDGVVRVVTIVCADKSQFRRAISELCLLPNCEAE